MDETLVAEHRRELMEAAGYEADLDLAFQLQMQEALVASLALQPSSSSSSPPPLLQQVLSTPSVSLLQTLELDKLELELKDRQQCETEMRKVTEDLNRRIHDQAFAKEITEVDEDDWVDFGDEIERPFFFFGEGSSSSVKVQEPFRLYCKGLFNVPTSTIGVAVCDFRDGLIFKIQKPLNGDWRNYREVELKALIEGMNAAISLDIKRINLYVTNRTIFNQIIGRWMAKQQRIATLVNQVLSLRQKFEICHTLLVSGNDLKYAFKLARDAIDTQITSSIGPSNTKNLKETCSICLEDTDAGEIFVVENCLHHYCFSCMKQHMEVKIRQGVVPGCPHEGCKTTLSLDGSKKLLTSKLIERMNQLIKESSVPVTEKVYCPYPKCSTLMSKKEALEYTSTLMIANTVVRKCVKCHGLFCIDCKVPWHSTMSCNEFKRSNPHARVEEAKLKSLANQNLWRQCVKCSHMIELAEGCYHMTCRCGYEFCYTCGAEWKNKKPTCSCKLWDERNILHDYEEDEDDFEDEDDYDEFGDENEEDDEIDARWRYAF